MGLRDLVEGDEDVVKLDSDDHYTTLNLLEITELFT